MTKAGWSVYILKCIDGTLYTGIARDVERRTAEHSAGRGAKYTRGRGPFEIAYTENCAGKGLALKREAAIKALPRQEKMQLINQV